MMLTPWQATTVAWTLGGLFIVGGALLAYWLRSRDRPGAGPVLVVLVLLGYIIAISRFANGTPVLIIRGDESSFVRSDARLYGSMSYSYADGHRESLEWLAARHLIVNDSPRTLKLRTVRYGYGGLSGIGEIAPFRQRALDGLLRHFGPDDPPPAQVETGESHRHWLYW